MSITYEWIDEDLDEDEEDESDDSDDDYVEHLHEFITGMDT